MLLQANKNIHPLEESNKNTKFVIIQNTKFTYEQLHISAKTAVIKLFNF